MIRLVLYGFFGLSIGGLVAGAIAKTALEQGAEVISVLTGAVIGLVLSVFVSIYLNRKNASYQPAPRSSQEIAKDKQTTLSRHAKLGTYAALIIVISWIFFPTQSHAFGVWLNDPLHTILFLVVGSLAGGIFWKFAPYLPP